MSRTRSPGRTPALRTSWRALGSVSRWKPHRVRPADTAHHDHRHGHDHRARRRWWCGISEGRRPPLRKSSEVSHVDPCLQVSLVFHSGRRSSSSPAARPKEAERWPRWRNDEELFGDWRSWQLRASCRLGRHCWRPRLVHRPHPRPR
jgi:hypothetical protein